MVSKWLQSLPHSHKIVIAGNHDWLFERQKKQAIELLKADYPNIVYLEDSGIEIMGLKFYGSPWQPWFYSWAFNVTRGQLHKYWDLIPSGLDILVTHGPPMGILDQAAAHLGSEHVGCAELITAVERTKPKIHVFGHIHGGYGKRQYGDTAFYNAAAVDEAYRPVNKPWILDI
jgi:Icc-related predicted phosphoesterase